MAAPAVENERSDMKTQYRRQRRHNRQPNRRWLWMGILAIAILDQVNIEEFKESTGKALTTVLEGDLDG